MSPQKKDGGLCPCIDYRGINQITVRYSYPLPLIASAIESMHAARFFTKLDIRGAYNLVRIREGDEWKTPFSTTSGHYQYLKLSPAERNYDLGDRELLAVVKALNAWRYWLEGAKQTFLIWADHRNLEYIRGARRLNPRQASHSSVFFNSLSILQQLVPFLPATALGSSTVFLSYSSSSPSSQPQLWAPQQSSFPTAARPLPPSHSSVFFNSLSILQQLVPFLPATALGSSTVFLSYSSSSPSSQPQLCVLQQSFYSTAARPLPPSHSSVFLNSLSILQQLVPFLPATALGSSTVFLSYSSSSPSSQPQLWARQQSFYPTAARPLPPSHSSGLFNSLSILQQLVPFLPATALGSSTVFLSYSSSSPSSQPQLCVPQQSFYPTAARPLPPSHSSVFLNSLSILQQLVPFLPVTALGSSTVFLSYSSSSPSSQSQLWAPQQSSFPTAARPLPPSHSSVFFNSLSILQQLVPFLPATALGSSTVFLSYSSSSPSSQPQLWAPQQSFYPTAARPLPPSHSSVFLNSLSILQQLVPFLPATALCSSTVFLFYSSSSPSSQPQLWAPQQSFYSTAARPLPPSHSSGLFNSLSILQQLVPFLPATALGSSTVFLFYSSSSPSSQPQLCVPQQSFYPTAARPLPPSHSSVFLNSLSILQQLVPFLPATALCSSTVFLSYSSSSPSSQPQLWALQQSFYPTAARPLPPSHSSGLLNSLSILQQLVPFLPATALGSSTVFLFYSSSSPSSQPQLWALQQSFYSTAARPLPPSHSSVFLNSLSILQQLVPFLPATALGSSTVFLSYSSSSPSSQPQLCVLQQSFYSTAARPLPPSHSSVFLNSLSILQQLVPFLPATALGSSTVFLSYSSSSPSSQPQLWARQQSFYPTAARPLPPSHSSGLFNSLSILQQLVPFLPATALGSSTVFLSYSSSSPSSQPQLCVPQQSFYPTAARPLPPSHSSVFLNSLSILQQLVPFLPVTALGSSTVFLSYSSSSPSSQSQLWAPQQSSFPTAARPLPPSHSSVFFNSLSILQQLVPFLPATALGSSTVFLSYSSSSPSSQPQLWAPQQSFYPTAARPLPPSHSSVFLNSLSILQQLVPFLPATALCSSTVFLFYSSSSPSSQPQLWAPQQSFYSTAARPLPPSHSSGLFNSLSILQQLVPFLPATALGSSTVFLFYSSSSPSSQPQLCVPQQSFYPTAARPLPPSHSSVFLNSLSILQQLVPFLPATALCSSTVFLSYSSSSPSSQPQLWALQQSFYPTAARPLPPSHSSGLLNSLSILQQLVPFLPATALGSSTVFLFYSSSSPSSQPQLWALQQSFYSTAARPLPPSHSSVFLNSLSILQQLVPFLPATALGSSTVFLSYSSSSPSSQPQLWALQQSFYPTAARPLPPSHSSGLVNSLSILQQLVPFLPATALGSSCFIMFANTTSSHPFPFNFRNFHSN
ncbi:melanoma-associated antigen C1-like [Salvelinus alpinus]|uniref:melanoma-associated antigen C1-like n=1 Tax=Salvelinus alpinus TaxID=8036 RepID=UPI0039FD0D32